MTQAEKLQNAADLHKAMGMMNHLRGDKDQADRDFANCQQWAAWASIARIRDGQGI